MPPVTTPRSLVEELFGGLPQQGPGSDESTRRALRALGELPAAAQVLDVGCGSGRQTVALSNALRQARVTASDLALAPLAALRRRPCPGAPPGRFRAVRASMAQLPFSPASFDLIWSEGAIYHVGFAAGLGSWRPLLRGGGAVAVTELSWLTDRRPAAAADFWRRAHPRMGDRAGNLDAARRAGYRVVTDFVLPPTDWRAFYGPLEARLDERQRRPADPAARALLDSLRQEIELYRTYGDVYGYVFYVLRVEPDATPGLSGGSRAADPDRSSSAP